MENRYIDLGLNISAIGLGVQRLLKKPERVSSYRYGG
jgi:hypothetical protein